MLKALIASLDDVEEGIRGFYEPITEDTAHKGKFALKVTATDGFALEDVTGLRTTLNTLRTERDTAANRLKEFGDLDPKVAKAAKAKADKYDQFDPEKEADKVAQAKLDAWKGQITETHTTELGAAKGEAEKWQRVAHRLTVTDAINRALDAAGVVGEDKELVADRMSRFVVLSEDGDALLANVVDDKKQPRYGSRGLPVTVEALALEFREKFPRNFKADVKPGSGAGGGSGAGTAYAGKNPFSKEHWNLTEQGKLFRDNKGLYDRLKAEAGA